MGENTKQDLSRRDPMERFIALGELCYLDLLPSLANLNEEAPRRRYVRQGSLCVALRVLHHGVTRSKVLQLNETERRKSSLNLMVVFSCSVNLSG